MAFQEGLVTITRNVYADYSAKQYYLMVLHTDGTAKLASSQGERTLGVLQDTPAAAGRPGCIAISGVSKVVAGGTIAAGDKLTVGTTGKAETASTGDYEFGLALESAVTGQIFSALIGNTQNIAA